MKYYVIKSSNGTVSIVSEWTDLDKVRVAFHDACKNMWNAKDVIIGYVAIIDSQLDTVTKEFISHPMVEPTPEPAEE